MNSSDEKFYNDCFTEIEEGKVNAEFNGLRDIINNSENFLAFESKIQISTLH